MTFTVYAENAGIPGAVLSTLTKTLPVLYRPSASAECTNPDGSLTGQWYNLKNRSCYNGYPRTVSMDLPGVTLTDKVIWSVEFNTSHYGDNPVGQAPECYATLAGHGYESLNVGVWSLPKAPFSGTDLDENQVFRNGVISLRQLGHQCISGSNHCPSMGRRELRPLSVVDDIFASMRMTTGVTSDEPS